MAAEPVSISTDQVAAFVELARKGSLRQAAAGLHLTEQGVRNRLLALEKQLGASLYLKQRGPRRRSPLTQQGEQFFPQALAFLERAEQMAAMFRGEPAAQEIHVASTQYLIMYVLIEAIRRFHAAHPAIRVRLSTHSEMEIEQALLHDPELDLGVAAPYEAGIELDYQHLFSLDWSLITPLKHPLLRKRKLDIADLANEPLIVYERGSTGRQHVLDAFRERSLSPRIELEATSTVVVVRMVEAGLGIALIPLMPGGSVIAGHRVATRSLPGRIRPIDSGILTRRSESLPAASRAFIEFLKR